MGSFQQKFISLCLISLLWSGGAIADGAADVVSSSTNSAPAIVENKAIPAIVTALLGNLMTTGVQAFVNSSNSGGQQASIGANTWPSGAASNAALCYANTANPNKLSAVLRGELLRAGCQMVTGYVGNLAQGITGNPPAFEANTFQPAVQVTQPLAYTASGTPNYQGLKVSALIVNNAGQVLEERPIGSNFYTGEKFRLRIQSTFPGFLEIMHTTPSGATKRLFPRPEVGQFMVSAGAEVVVPLGDNVYEFLGDTGVERLILNIRDPRVSQAAQQSGQVYRQDMPEASYYAQSMAEGQLPAISQPIQILHSGR